MLLGSDEPDRSQLVHGHLAHASEDVFAANADTAAQLVGVKWGQTLKLNVSVVAVW